MIKIVVAEDQLLIQKDLCQKIKKADSSATIVAAALNGKDAYEKIKDLKPDLLFTDIRMPILSGLELIRRLKSEGISLYTVIISGYKDFDYAKEAIQLGVDEYLLKPLSIEDLRFVIYNIREKINARNKDYNQHMIEEFLRSNAGVNPFTQIQTNFLYTHYYLMTVMTGSFPSFSLEAMNPNTPADELISLPRLIEPRLKPGEKVYVSRGKFYNESICVLCLNESGETLLTDISTAITDSIGEFKTPATICLSREIKHIDNIGIESQIMRNYISQKLIFANSSVFTANVVSINTQTCRRFLKEDLLKKALYLKDKNQETQFIRLVHDFLDELALENATQKELELCLKELYTECFCASFDMDIDEFLTNSRSYEELLSYLDFISAQQFRQLGTAAYNLNAEKLLQDILAYIQKNYHQDININDIAKAFNLTPAYFSRLFKKYTNTRPIEYLTGLRMEHACEYFAQTQLSVKDICELCGYTDPFYFSKIFKNATGFSPTEYRIRNQNTGDVSLPEKITDTK